MVGNSQVLGVLMVVLAATPKASEWLEVVSVRSEGWNDDSADRLLAHICSPVLS